MCGVHERVSVPWDIYLDPTVYTGRRSHFSNPCKMRFFPCDTGHMGKANPLKIAIFPVYSATREKWHVARVESRGSLICVPFGPHGHGFDDFLHNFSSGCVRPRQGTEICNLLRSFLQWNYPFSPGFLCYIFP